MRRAKRRTDRITDRPVRLGALTHVGRLQEAADRRAAPGVSRDIFGPQERQESRPAQGPSAAGGTPGKGGLPPAAPPAQPWPMASEKEPAQPAPVFGTPQRPSSYEPEPPRRRRLLPAIISLVVILAALAYVVPAVLMSGSVLRGTRVAGVDIGGLTVTKAADKLRAELASKLSKPVIADIGGQKETIQPDEAGLELDVVGTIGQAPSGFPTPEEVWRGLTGTTDLPPKITLDAAQLTRTVEGLAGSVDKPAREGRITYSGLEPQARTPANGVLLDREDAVRRIGAAFLSGGGSVVLTVRPAKPVTSSGGRRRGADQGQGRRRGAADAHARAQAGADPAGHDRRQPHVRRGRRRAARAPVQRQGRARTGRGQPGGRGAAAA
ncbi:hypothetical protein GCM10020001_028560 [Nonomuraea salmonea]